MSQLQFLPLFQSFKPFQSFNLDSSVPGDIIMGVVQIVLFCRYHSTFFFHLIHFGIKLFVHMFPPVFNFTSWLITTFFEKKVNTIKNSFNCIFVMGLVNFNHKGCGIVDLNVWEKIVWGDLDNCIFSLVIVCSINSIFWNCTFLWAILNNISYVFKGLSIISRNQQSPLLFR